MTVDGSDKAAPPSGGGTGSGRHQPGEEAAVSFSEFVLSLATNAVVHLGEDSDGDRLSTRSDLAAASQHIDIIAMLREKTQGNLSNEELQLVDALLYDLRMKYLEAAQRRSAQSD